LNAVTVESAKGIRLAKGTQSSKIDACAALSFAALAAVRAGKPPISSDSDRRGGEAYTQKWDSRFEWSFNR